MIYKCPKCTKKFKQKSHYNTHLNKKNICRPPILVNTPNHTVTTEIIQPNIINVKNAEDNKFQCTHCLKILSRGDALQRHVVNYCKVKKKKNIIEANNDKPLMDTLEEMRNEIASLQKMCTEITEKNIKLKEENNLIINTIVQNIADVDNISSDFEIINDNNDIPLFEMEQSSEIVNNVHNNDFVKGEINSIMKPNKSHNYYISNNSALVFDGTDWTLIDNNIRA